MKKDVGLFLFGEIVLGLILSFMIGVSFLLAFMTLGGNGVIDIPFAGLRGYESGGLIGALVGETIGSILGVLLARTLMKQPQRTLWIMAGAVSGGILTGLIQNFGPSWITSTPPGLFISVFPLIGALVASHVKGLDKR